MKTNFKREKDTSRISDTHEYWKTRGRVRIIDNQTKLSTLMSTRNTAYIRYNLNSKEVDDIIKTHSADQTLKLVKIQGINGRLPK